MKIKRALIAIGAAAALTLTVAGCSSQADGASYNLSKDADSFKIHRDIVFHDDLTDTNIAEISGLCSLGNDDPSYERTVTCKISADTFVKEIFDMGDNTSVSSVQTEPSKTNPFAYEVILKPTGVSFDLQKPGN